MSNDDRQSRIDAKLKRDSLIKNGLEALWDGLWSEVEDACKKLNQHWNSKLSPKLNDSNSVIRVEGPPTDWKTEDVPMLEIRLDRKEKKAIARLSHENTSLGVYQIKADLTTGRVNFTMDKVIYTPQALAELLVAEQLAGLKLDD